MKNIFNVSKKTKSVLILMSLFFTVSFSNAATITSTTTGGTWSIGSTWIGGKAPATGDTVIIATTGIGTVAITANLTQNAAGSVTVNNGAILTTSGGTVTFGSLTIISGGTATISRATTVLGATNISGTLNFSSTSGTSRLITFTGDVTLNSGAVWTEPSTGNGANNTYNFGGNFTNNATTFNALGNGLHTFSGATKTISGSRVTSIATITFTGAYTNNSIISCAKALTVTGVKLTNNGTITATTALSGTGGLTQGTSGVLNIGGTSAITTVTASAIGNTVNYTGVAQTIHSNIYYNLTLSGSGIAVLQSGTTTIGGNLTLSGTVATTTVVNFAISGNLTVGAGTTLTTGSTFTLGVTGTSSVTGALTLGGTGAKTFTGDVTLNSGGVWNETGIATINCGGNLINNAAAFTANSGMHTFSGATKTLSGVTTIAIPTATFTGAYTNNGVVISSTLLTVTGVTLTNNGTITASTSLTGTGGVAQGTTGVLNIGGTIGITTLTASAIGNTVNYTGAAQTGCVTTYSNLTLSGSAAKTFAATPTVNAVLSLEGTASVVVTTGVITYGGTAALQYNKAASYTATSEEWISPFLATGGIRIKNTGAITTPGNIQLGNNTSVPLNINIGATLTPGANAITFHGDFINAGTLTSGSGGVTIAGTTTIQSIAGFSTTGNVTLTKTAGMATFTGNVNGNAFTINGSGGILNLGIGLIHTFTGEVALTAGNLNGGSSTINENSVSTTAWKGTGSLFTAASSTVNFGAAGNQTIAANSIFYNLSLSNSGIKTFSNATTINNNFSISGTAVANLGSGLTHSSISLTLGGTAQAIGVWGATASSASNKNATWFGSSATGIVNVNCLAPSAPTSVGNRTICSNETMPSLTATVGGDQTIDWYTQASGGTLLQSSSTSYTPSIAGTYYAETKNATTGCLSSTRTGVALIINSTPTIFSLTGNIICVSPGGNGTITTASSQSGVNYQLYDSSNTAVQSAKAGIGASLIWTGLPAATGYYVKAMNATSGCFSTTATVDVATNTNPTAPVLTGSLICTSPGDDGTIISSTSETGVDYQLYNLSNAIVQAEQTGTGSGLTWSFLNPGNGYYVKGTNSITGCVSSNSNAVNITVTANPVALVLTGSAICASPGDNGTITTSTSVVGVDYQLNDNLDNDIGTPITGTGAGLTFTGVTIGTGYYVISTNAAGCISVNSNSVDVTTTPNNTVSKASSTHTLSVNSALTNITHSSTGATGIGTANGLPTGVTASWASNTITISGTPTVSGTFNYSIPLTGGCDSVNATGTITVKNIIAPIIETFTVPTKNYGDAAFTLTAPTSNSVGAFTYTSSNSAVATISGSTVTIVGAGTATITATQAANGNYALGTKTTSLTVNTIAPIIGTLTIPTKNYGDAAFTLTAPTSNSVGTFTYSSSNSAVATISGSTVTIVGAGTTIITATQVANGNYALGIITTTLMVNKLIPIITAIGNTTYVYNGYTQGPATSNVTGSIGTVTYSYSGIGNTIYAASVTQPINAGTYQVIATVAADMNYSEASSEALSFTIEKAQLTITANAQYKFEGIPFSFLNNEFMVDGLMIGDGVSAASLMSSGGDAPATAIGSPYIISISDARGSGLSNYNITYVGSLFSVSLVPVAGTITGVFGEICPGGSKVLTNNNGVGTIQWEMSLNNVDFTPIANATSNAYTAVVSSNTYFRVVRSAGTVSIVSPSFMVGVADTTIAGTISGGNVTYCSGTNNTTVLTIGGAVGSVQWQYAVSEFGTYRTIWGQNDKTLVVKNLNGNGTNYYFAKVSLNCSTEKYTYKTKITFLKSIAGTISGAGAVCSGNTKTLTLRGNIGAVQWQSSTDNNIFMNITGATSTSYTTTPLTSVTYYRVVVTNESCDSVTSPSVAITIDAPILAGSIKEGDITVCTANPATLTLVNNSVGAIAWYKSINYTSGSPTWTAVIGQTNTTLISGNLTVSTWYKAKVTSGTCFDETAVVKVTINPKSIVKTISGAGTICSGGSKSLTLVIGSIGSLQWQSSSTSATATDFTAILGATSLTYAASPTTTTWYRVVSTSGVCSSAISAAVAVTVSQPVSVGNLTASSGTVCSGTGTSLTLSASQGTIVWQKATVINGVTGTFATVTGNVSSTLTTGNLTATTAYRSVVTNGSCAATSTAVSIIVSPAAKVTAISGFNTATTKVCVGSSQTLTLSAGYVGTIEWLSSPTLTGIYTVIAGATASSYNYIPTTAGVKYFKVRTTSSPCSVQAVSTTGVAVYADNCSSAREQAKTTVVSDEFKVMEFPNPFTDMFTLEVSTPSSSKKKVFDIQVYDMTGRFVEQRQIQQSENIQMGSSYSSGLYIITITQGQQVKTLRVIKK